MSLLVLMVTTFIAAVLQTVTGFGFGLICVPLFLLIINSVVAIQYVIIITLVMSIAVLYSVRGQFVPRLLMIFSLGCLIGSPIGVFIFNNLNLNALKALVAVIIVTFTICNAYQYFNSLKSKVDTATTLSPGKTSTQFGVGIASGILTTTIAMPAPLIMLYLSGTSYDKSAIRATILTFFILAYSIALVCQVYTQGISEQTIKSAALLCPAALLGVFIGNTIAPKVSQHYFKMIVFLTLLLTSLFMLGSIL